jgi:hypothetical protein
MKSLWSFACSIEIATTPLSLPDCGHRSQKILGKTHRERPSNNRAAEQRDELAPSHSITASHLPAVLVVR